MPSHAPAGLPAPRVQDAELQRWIESISQRLRNLPDEINTAANVAARAAVGGIPPADPPDPIDTTAFQPAIPNLETPPNPSGVQVFFNVDGAFITWNNPFAQYSNHAQARIYRNLGVNHFDTATYIGQSEFVMYFDTTTAPGSDYHYWVVFRSTTGVDGQPTYAGSGRLGQVGSGQIENEAITRGKIDNGAVVAGNLDSGAVLQSNIRNLAVVASKLAANAVVLGKIAAGAVDESALGTDAVTAAKIKAGAVEAGKIAANSITAAQIAANTIGAGQIVANSITAAQIAANTITASEIAAKAITGTLLGDAVLTNLVARHGTLQQANIQRGDIFNLTINDEIKSVGYTAGSTGWRIARDGSAEFEYGNIRGDLDVLNVAVGNEIKSSNYRAGSDTEPPLGWRIAQDGEAHFDAASIYGTLSAAHIESDVRNWELIWSGSEMRDGGSGPSGTNLDPRSTYQNLVVEADLVPEADRLRDLDFIICLAISGRPSDIGVALTDTVVYSEPNTSVQMTAPIFLPGTLTRAYSDVYAESDSFNVSGGARNIFWAASVDGRRAYFWSTNLSSFTLLAVFRINYPAVEASS